MPVVDYTLMLDASCFPETETASFGAGDTHSIELASGSRVVLDSEGLGWTNLYAVLTSERRWTGVLQPIEHTCFAYCLRRSATIMRHIEGEDHSTTDILRPRQIGLLPTRVASRWHLTGSADIMMVYLRSALVERVARQAFGRSARDFDIRPRIGILDPLLEQLSLKIVAALHRRDRTEDPAYIDQIAAMAASHLLRHHAHRQSPVPPQPSLGAGLYGMRDYIDHNLDQDLGLDSLAREANLAPALFTQAFTAIYRDTPHQYVIKRRVERTKHLLIGTDLSIAEVALQAGFSSQSHLSDVFKRSTGETPRNFRRGGPRKEL